MNYRRSMMVSVPKLLGMCLLWLATQCVFAGEFAVSPMLIELESTQRSVQPFTFSLYGKSDTNVRIVPFEMQQQTSGYMEFKAVAADTLDSIANWVDLEDDTYRLRDGDVVTVKGTISIPARASGSHAIALMVEEDIPDAEAGGINVRIRYAVVLNLRIDGGMRRVATEFNELVAVENNGELFLQGSFANNSDSENWLFSQVQLRDENNRLVERIAMKTQSAWQRGDDGSRIFPGAKVFVFGKLPADLAPGTYTAMVRNTFAEKSQPVFRESIYLAAPAAAPADAVAAAPDADSPQTVAAGTILINPDAPAVTVKDNGSSFTSFYIVNNNGSAVTVELPESSADAQAHGVTRFRFLPASVKLLPGQKAKVVLSQEHSDPALYGEVIYTANIRSESSGAPSALPIRTVSGS